MSHSDPDEFIPERFVKGDPDHPLPYILLWVALILCGVLWASS